MLFSFGSPTSRAIWNHQGLMITLAPEKIQLPGPPDPSFQAYLLSSVFFVCSDHQ